MFETNDLLLIGLLACISFILIAIRAYRSRTTDEFTEWKAEWHRKWELDYEKHKRHQIASVQSEKDSTTQEDVTAPTRRKGIEDVVLSFRGDNWRSGVYRFVVDEPDLSDRAKEFIQWALRLIPPERAIDVELVRWLHSMEPEDNDD